MCPRCEGRGSVNDIDLSALYDDSKSLNEGALTIPGYSMEGVVRPNLQRPRFFDPDKPINRFTKRELDALLLQGADEDQGRRINLTYAGLIPQIKKSFLSKDIDAMQPHIRAFVSGRRRSRRVPNVTAPGSRRRRPPPGSTRSTSPTSAPCRSATWRSGSLKP